MTTWKILAASGLAVLSITAAAVWAVVDYGRWRALGVGGLPPTVRGWLQVSYMRLLGGDPFSIDAVPPANLQRLSRRRGTRPEVAPHPVPHRVLTQHAPETIKAELTHLLDGFVGQEHTPRLRYETSCWEKHNQALFVDCEDEARGDASQPRSEIGHMHPSDGSMHVILGQGDAAAVISQGWGELHPLAGRMLELPATYTLLYPPRDAVDLASIAQIIQAAINFASEQYGLATPI